MPLWAEGGKVGSEKRHPAVRRVSLGRSDGLSSGVRVGLLHVVPYR
jgi:hypothetical protein